MNVLLLNNEFHPIGGGGATVTRYVGGYLAAQGHDVRLVTSSFHDLPREEEVDGIRVYRAPALRRKADYSSVFELLTYTASASLACARLLREFRPDVVHAHFAVPAGAIAWLLRRRYGIPYAIYMGGSDVPGANPGRYRRLYPLLTPFIRRFFREASFVSGASQRLIDLARAVHPSSDYAFIPNGADLQRFRPASPPPEPPVRILSVGRLIPRKGFQHLIEALPRVIAESGPGVMLQIVGTGDYEAELRRLAVSLGVADHVEFLGAIPYDQLHHTYADAHIFAMVSLAEGMPLALLEAMACGLPVVASRVAGNEDVVEDGDCGYLVTPEDVGEIAEALSHLVNDPGLRRTMGQRSRALSCAYDWRTIAQQYERALLQIATPSRPVHSLQ